MKFNIELYRYVSELTDDDIMQLLTPVNPSKGYFIEKRIYKIKKFFRKLCDWNLIISINNIDYEFSLKGLVKIRHIYKDLSFEEEQQIYKRIQDVQESGLPPEERIKKVEEIIAEIYRREVLKLRDC